VEIQLVLAQFSDVFRKPNDLSPPHDIVHSIEMYKEAKLVSVHPYRYPYHHKDEIEIQVDEMLQQGIIRRRSSAFSNPVILVKKNVASWHLCMDCRELNKLIVLDKYMIPVVEEFSDELHRPTYFSKLDFKSRVPSFE